MPTLAPASARAAFKPPNPPPTITTDGIRDSGFGIRDSGFGLRASGFGIRDSGFGLRASGLGIGAAGFSIAKMLSYLHAESAETRSARSRSDSWRARVCRRDRVPARLPRRLQPCGHRAEGQG